MQTTTGLEETDGAALAWSDELGRPQPIESAPHESMKRLLLFDGYWMWGYWRGDSECWIDDEYLGINPTHWLPEPQNPNAA